MYPLWEELNRLKKCRWVELCHPLNNQSPYWGGIPEGSVELGKTVFDWGNERVTPKFCVKSNECRNGAKFICRRQRHDRLPPISTT